jgi:ABC-2 type transport system permease protein
MSADMAAPAAITFMRSPETVIVQLTASKAARSAIVWGAVFGLYVASSALGYAATYKTPQAREQLAATFGANAGFNALIGPAHQIGTVAGFTAWRALGVLSIVGGVWGLLVGTRLLRGEEDSGRWELLLAGHTTRRGATAKAVGGLAAGLLTLFGTTALITVAVGQGSTVNIGVGGSLYLTLALVAAAAIFLAAGALTSQLAPTRRQAAAYGAATLGASYVLRMIADSGTGLDWLRWLSPLGWVEELRPLSSPQPWMIVPITALIALLAGAAIHLAGTRDLCDSIITDHTSARPRTGLLSGPAGLAIRLTRGALTGWAVSITLLGLLMGLIAKSVGKVLATNAGDRETFAKMGFRGSGAVQYLAITFLIVALLLALVAAGQLNAARSEEADGRLDHLLVRPLSRQRWLVGRLVAATTVLVLAGLLAALAAWVGAASQHSGVGLGTLLAAGLNVVPPALVVLGIGTLAMGLWPRGVSPVVYSLLAWSFLIEIIGGFINASRWVLDTSLFHQMAAAPAIDPNWTSNAVMTATGISAAAAGGLAFRRRDLAAA